MRKVSQEEQLEDLTRKPIPKKKVGIVHFQIMKESRVLYGMRRFTTPPGGGRRGVAAFKEGRSGNGSGFIPEYQAGTAGDRDRCGGRSEPLCCRCKEHF